MLVAVCAPPLLFLLDTRESSPPFLSSVPCEARQEWASANHLRILGKLMSASGSFLTQRLWARESSVVLSQGREECGSQGRTVLLAFLA